MTATPLVGTPPPAFQAPPTPVLPIPRARTVADGTFDANQRAQAARVSSYLSSLPTLVGNFVQVAPNGNRSTSKFYMQKPGKVRFAYDPPTPDRCRLRRHLDGGARPQAGDAGCLSAVADAVTLSTVGPHRSDAQTPMSSTSPPTTCSSPSPSRKSRLIGTSRLMLMLGAKDNQLKKQWTVTDPQGYDTTVAVYNLNTQKKPDPRLFTIDFTRYDRHAERLSGRLRTTAGEPRCAAPCVAS